MGELVFAARVTHVPSAFVSEMPGPLHGIRDPAIAGLEAIGRRVRAAGADTLDVEYGTLVPRTDPRGA